MDALDLPEPNADGFIRTPRNRYRYKYSNEEGVLMWLFYFARVGTLRKRPAGSAVYNRRGGHSVIRDCE